MFAVRIFKHQQRPVQVIIKDGHLERGVDIEVVKQDNLPGHLAVKSIYTLTQASTANTKGYREISRQSIVARRAHTVAVESLNLALRNLFSALSQVV